MSAALTWLQTTPLYKWHALQQLSGPHDGPGHWAADQSQCMHTQQSEWWSERDGYLSMPVMNPASAMAACVPHNKLTWFAAITAILLQSLQQHAGSTLNHLQAVSSPEALVLCLEKEVASLVSRTGTDGRTQCKEWRVFTPDMMARGVLQQYRMQHQQACMNGMLRQGDMHESFLHLQTRSNVLTAEQDPLA